MSDAAAPAPPAPPAAALPPAATAPVAPPTWRPGVRRWPIRVGIVAIAVVAILVLLYAWDLPPFAGGIERTDDAYVRGRTMVIAPQVSGYVVEVAVHDYERVQAGQVLARIDDRVYRARVELARANLDLATANLRNSAQAHAAREAQLKSQQAASASARAQLEREQADMGRATELSARGSISLRERDQTLAGLRQAEALVRQSAAAIDIARQDIRTVDVGRDGLQAQVEAARAQLDAAAIDLEHTVIRAPESGQLGEVGTRLGVYVTNGTQLMAVVPDDRWVIANFKESQTASMQPGQPVTLTVDALEGKRLSGRIERLSPAAGSEFAVLKPDNATGNFVKVPQRIGVRIAIDRDQPLAARLRPGMSVVVRIDAHARPATSQAMAEANR